MQVLDFKQFQLNKKRKSSNLLSMYEKIPIINLYLKIRICLPYIISNQVTIRL